MAITIIGELPPLKSPILTPGDSRKDCCRLAENLEYHEYDPDKGINVSRCKICGCRHFEINAEPGKLGLRR